MHLELEADKLRGAILSQEARVQLVEEQLVRVIADEGGALNYIEDLKVASRHLAEQVQNQAYSKKDIERLKYERTHLHEVLRDLRTDSDMAEQDVWELNMQESRRVEAIGRLVRQVNEGIESLDGAFAMDAGTRSAELSVIVDLTEPSDTLAAQDFEDLHRSIQAAAAMHGEATQTEEVALYGLHDEQREVQDELAVKEREHRRLKDRLEQLTRMREEYREWSAAQLDDAQRTVEATEDAVHGVSIGTTAPSIRDAAEIDKLRLTLNAIQVHGVHERVQLEEQIQRDEVRFEDHRQSVLHHIDMYFKEVEALSQEINQP